MKKVVISIISLILALAIGLGCLSFAISKIKSDSSDSSSNNSWSDFWGGILGGDSDDTSSDTSDDSSKDTTSDTSDDSSKDTTSDTSASDTEFDDFYGENAVTVGGFKYVPGDFDTTDEYVLKLGEGALTRIVSFNYGEKSYYGFLLCDLAQNTEYTVEFKVNDNFRVATGADYVYHSESTYPRLCFIKDLSEFPSCLHVPYYSTDTTSSINIKTGTGSDIGILYFAESEFVSFEADESICRLMYPYITSLTIVAKTNSGVG